MSFIGQSCIISVFEVVHHNTVISFNFELEKLGERQYFGWADGGVWIYDEAGESTFFASQKDSTGWVMIDTIDKHTLVGTFQYKASTGPTLHAQTNVITEGWFDISID